MNAKIENRDTIKDEFLKSRLIKTIQNKDFAPETVVLVGNGAIEGGDTPLLKVLKDHPFIELSAKQHKIFYSNPSPSHLLAYYSYFFSALKNRAAVREASNHKSESFSGFMDAFISFREELGKAYQEAMKNNQLTLRKIPDCIAETIGSPTTALICTNWDEVLWNTTNVKNLIQIHGRCTFPKTLILPLEMSDGDALVDVLCWTAKNTGSDNHDKLKSFSEKYTREEYQPDVRSAHNVAVHWLERTKKVVVWGLSFHPYDAELISILVNTHPNQTTKDKVTIINPNGFHRDVIASLMRVCHPEREDHAE